MLQKQAQLIPMYERVKAFFAAHTPPAPAPFAEPLKDLDAVVAEIQSHAASQVSGGRLTKAERKRQQSLIERLCVDHLRPIVTIARANVDGNPGIEKAIRMPNRAQSVARFLADAEAIRAVADLYPPVFVRNGRPEDFAAQLSAAIEAVRQAGMNQGTLAGRRSAARVGLSTQLARGRRVLDVLDSLVKSAFAGDPVVLEAWDVAKRTRSVGGGGSDGSAATQPPTPATVPSAAPVSPTATTPQAA